MTDIELARSLEVQALCILAEQFNVPPDMQEWLLAGVPDLRIKPGALRAIMSTALAAGREAERKVVVGWLHHQKRTVETVWAHLPGEPSFSTAIFDDLANTFERGDHAPTTGGGDA